MTWRTTAACAALLVLLGACGGNEADESPPTSITGVVVDIDARGLGDVRSFVVRSDGTTYEIFVDPDAEYGFPLGHLAEHRATSDPVVVGLEERDGRLYATSIEDA